MSSPKNIHEISNAWPKLQLCQYVAGIWSAVPDNSKTCFQTGEFFHTKQNGSAVWVMHSDKIPNKN